MDVAGYIGHPSSCVILYKNIWPEDQNYPERLEACLADSEHEYFHWGNATVGDIELMKDYRACSDFKIGGTQGEQMDYYKNMPAEFADLKAMYQESMEAVHACVDHYTSMYNIDLEYFEAPNYIKYDVGQHFQVHPDCGFSYTCTTSIVGFFNTCNEDYTGGELVFPFMDVKFTPEKNDLIVFPSNYPYVHQSLPIESGTKYSMVVMYDYNDRNHRRDQTLAGQIGIPDHPQIETIGATYPKVG